LKYDILAVYGKVRLRQSICRECKSKFFILDNKQNTFYCEDCLSDFNNKKLSHSQNPKIIYHLRNNRRRYIPKKVRFEIYKRDNYKCIYCGKDLYDDFLIGTGKITVDHFVPYSVDRGGAIFDNLFTACKRCNCSKFSTLFNSLEEVREYLKSRGKIENAEKINN